MYMYTYVNIYIHINMYIYTFFSIYIHTRKKIFSIAESVGGRATKIYQRKSC